MGYRDNFITGKVRSFLDRKSVPHNLDGKPEAQMDELSALVRAVLRYSPRVEYEDWWPRFEDRLDEECTTRGWPKVSDIKKAASGLRGPVVKLMAEGNETDPMKINAKRINAGDGVGDSWVYGRGAVELLRGDHVDLDTMRKYRSSLFFNAKAVYGENLAKKMESDLVARHRAAETLDDNLRTERNLPKFGGQRMVTQDWD